MSTVNLLPEDFLKNRARKRANILCLILFLIVMIGVVAAGAVSDRNDRETRKVCADVNASYAEAAKLIEQLHQLQEQKGILLAKAEQAAALQERVPRSYILGALANACPEHASIMAIRLECRTAEAEKASKFDAVAAQRAGKSAPIFVDLTVTGQANTDTDVARFITELARNPLLSNVDLNYTEERSIEKNLVREFQVKMEIKPGVDVLDIVDPPTKKGGGPFKALAHGAPSAPEATSPPSAAPVPKALAGRTVNP